MFDFSIKAVIIAIYVQVIAVIKWRLWYERTNEHTLRKSVN